MFNSALQWLSDLSSGPADGSDFCSVPQLCNQDLDHLGVLKSALRITGVYTTCALHCACVTHSHERFVDIALPVCSRDSSSM